MGYQHIALKAACGKCGSGVYWSWESWGGPGNVVKPWKCQECGALNTPKRARQSYHSWPEVPQSLYLGHDWNNQVKLYPVPPEALGETWAEPYSIRSFVYQASRLLGGCEYHPSERGFVMNEPAFSDRCSLPEASQSWDDWNLRCSFPEASELYADWNCHMVMGWTKGKPTCDLWQRVSALCQTDAERGFLHQYLAFVKDRVFPMLIPQPRMGIAQRRRPDFVLFVPLCYWNYRWYAVQLDKGHPPERAKEDDLRDAEIGGVG